MKALGLDALLEQCLGVVSAESRQKDDWSRRPLNPEQEAYALNDVLHLIELREALLGALHQQGRAAWVEEECAALAAQSVPEKPDDPDAYLKLKGAKDLDRRGWAVLRELYRAREALALELDRPPFMIITHEALVALAVKRPRRPEEILEVPGCSSRVAARAGHAILGAVARGEAVPERDLPSRHVAPRPHVPAATRHRALALRAWRSEAARALDLDPGVLLPQRLIDRLAADAPRDLAALVRTDIRRWRVELFGEALLKAVAVA
jgi:ribonuclease D